MQIDSFHVEFDTWDNDDKDPTFQNHIAIALDGDPSNYVLWTPQVLEDSSWHSVQIIIFGQNITVLSDGRIGVLFERDNHTKIDLAILPALNKR